MEPDQKDTEEKRKAREGRILFIVFGTLITPFIAAMLFADIYAESIRPGPKEVHDAADR